MTGGDRYLSRHGRRRNFGFCLVRLEDLDGLRTRHRFASFGARHYLLTHRLRRLGRRDEIKRRYVNREIPTLLGFEAIVHSHKFARRFVRPAKLGLQPRQPLAMLEPRLSLGKPLPDKDDSLGDRDQVPRAAKRWQGKEKLLRNARV